LTIQVSFLRGQAVYVTTHFYKSRTENVRLWFLSKAIHHHLQETFAQCDVALYWNLLTTPINQHFMNFC
jgi:hypothetical protein